VTFEAGPGESFVDAPPIATRLEEALAGSAPEVPAPDAPERSSFFGASVLSSRWPVSIAVETAELTSSVARTLLQPWWPSTIVLGLEPRSVEDSAEAATDPDRTLPSAEGADRTATTMDDSSGVLAEIPSIFPGAIVSSGTRRIAAESESSEEPLADEPSEASSVAFCPSGTLETASEGDLGDMESSFVSFPRSASVIFEGKPSLLCSCCRIRSLNNTLLPGEV